jgi:molybdate transport system ATP-binding protein
VSLHATFSVPRDRLTVDVDLHADPGETVALLGPNGAGKSTALAVLAGLLEPSSGRVELDGEVLDDAAGGRHVPAERRPVGVVFQDLLLFPHLDATDNVAYPLRAGGTPKAEARRRAREALERLDVAHRARARPRSLSGGEAQRVALARATVAQPRLLLLDEPLSALDVATRVQTREVLRDVLARYDGIRVLVTHDPVEATTLADRIVLLEDGRVTQTGTADEIRDTPRTPYAAHLVGVNRFEGRLEPADPGVGLLRTPHGDLLVAWPEWATEGVVVDRVLALLDPTDVTLFDVRPEGSARNAVEGDVRSVSVEGGRARVRIGTSPPLVAEVTPASVDRLALVPGRQVWASFKAVEVRVIPG